MDRRDYENIKRQVGGKLRSDELDYLDCNEDEFWCMEWMDDWMDGRMHGYIDVV